MFNIKKQPVIDVYLLDGTGPHVFPVDAELVDELHDFLADPNGVLRVNQITGRTIRFPRNAIAFVADHEQPDMRQARVDLYQDAGGRVYLADPEHGLARLVQTLALGQFGNDSRALLAGDVELVELVDAQEAVPVGKLQRIAEYPHAGVMRIVGHLAGIKLSESARKYIGEHVVDELTKD